MKLIFTLILLATTVLMIDGIIQGSTTRAHWWPFLVFIERNKHLDSRCGGSLISKNYVLTAAQCVKGTTALTLTFGLFDLTDKQEQGHVIYQVQRDDVKIHEYFDETTLENDIALIKLDKPIEITDTINTVKVATKDDIQNLVGQEAITIGWGQVNPMGTPLYADVPEAIWIHVIDRYGGECSERFGSLIQETNICCEHVNLPNGPNLNLCDGDYGGPLAINATFYSSETLLVGVASFSTKKCNLAYPNVFTDVSKYTDWIKENSDVVF
ncbi:unnamed protein product [Phyllotreta striolata]|uniref:Peptidase S1 domain-containing protein n=1 Tax=Phyllotreta striolata TaxID=444603 RepID=A0A9N9TGE3_PHYSR|nr:unnamed protein product [Phyllotreta striolata]